MLGRERESHLGGDTLDEMEVLEDVVSVSDRSGSAILEDARRADRQGVVVLHRTARSKGHELDVSGYVLARGQGETQISSGGICPASEPDVASAYPRVAVAGASLSRQSTPFGRARPLTAAVLALGHGRVTVGVRGGTNPDPNGLAAAVEDRTRLAVRAVNGGRLRLGSLLVHGHRSLISRQDAILDHGGRQELRQSLDFDLLADLLLDPSLEPFPDEVLEFLEGAASVRRPLRVPPMVLGRFEGAQQGVAPVVGALEDRCVLDGDRRVAEGVDLHQWLAAGDGCAASARGSRQR